MTKRPKGPDSKGLSKKILKSRIEGLFNLNTALPLNYKQISSRLDLKDPGQQRLVMEVLNELTRSGQLTEVQRGKYKMKMRGAYITGTVQMTRSGSAFILSEETKDEVYVNGKNLNRAFNGDKVKVYVFGRREGQKLVGEIVEILEQRERTYVGTIERSSGYYFLIPDNRGMPYDIFIHPKNLKGG